jgi:hypothetical protein
MFTMAKMLVLCVLPSALADQDSHGDEVDIVTLLDSVAAGQKQISWPSWEGECSTTRVTGDKLEFLPECADEACWPVEHCMLSRRAMAGVLPLGEPIHGYQTTLINLATARALIYGVHFRFACEGEGGRLHTPASSAGEPYVPGAGLTIVEWPTRSEVGCMLRKDKDPNKWRLRMLLTKQGTCSAIPYANKCADKIKL